MRYLTKHPRKISNQNIVCVSKQQSFTSQQQCEDQNIGGTLTCKESSNNYDFSRISLYETGFMASKCIEYKLLLAVYTNHIDNFAK